MNDEAQYGLQVYISPLTSNDVGHAYLSWMNDIDLTQYMESRFAKYNLRDLKDYVENVSRDKQTYMWGVYETATDLHVGNIKLGPIDPNHMNADIGLIIGERKVWGRGYATEAIKLVCRHSFSSIGLNKITAGIYSVNKGSEKAFINAGFKREGLLQDQYVFEGGFVDKIIMGLTKRQFEEDVGEKTQ